MNKEQAEKFDRLHVRPGTFNEYRERDRREAKFEADFPNGFDRLSDEIDAMKQYGLYCGTCSHGLGCEHGVPASRY